jgi:hypothetical protein
MKNNSLLIMLGMLISIACSYLINPDGNPGEPICFARNHTVAIDEKITFGL